MAAKRSKPRIYTPYMRQKKHHAKGYFASLGRKGGNTTKARHGRTGYYARIGRAGGQATKRKHP